MKKPSRTILLLLILTLIIVLPAGAEPDLYRATTPMEYLNIRQMAMGGAGVSLVQGVETVYSNPARIVDAGDNFAFPLIPVLLNQSTLQIGNDLVGVVNKAKTALADSDDDTVKATEKFAKMIPSYMSMGACVPYVYTGDSFMEFLGSQMAIGGYSRLWGRLSLLNPVSPRLEYDIKLDNTFGITFARKFDTEGKLLPEVKDSTFGFTIKHLGRIAAYDIERDLEKPEITITDIVNEDVSYQYYDVAGWAFDLGYSGKVNTYFGPSQLGIAIYNINARLDGNQFISTSENTEAVDKMYVQVPATARVGLSFENMFLKDISNAIFTRPTLWAFDYAIIYPSDSYVKRTHLGLEQPLSENTFWQMGLYQGYGTMGVQWRWPNYNLGFAYYTEELGDEAGQIPNSNWLLNAGAFF